MEEYKQENIRIGEINYNKYGSKFIIIEYNNYFNIKVKFNNGYILKTTYEVFKRGVSCCSPYDITVCDIGYLGEGKYKATNNKIINKNYDVWSHMLMRCYKTEINKKFITYEKCIVCDEWLNFQNFAKWYEDNYYKIENERMELDKDILIKGNKVYSPENCVFVPHSINTLFIKRQNDRGDYPIGVNLDKNRNKFKAECSVKGYRKKIGRYNTPEEAFNAYKIYKEQLIKQIADTYKDKYYQFPQKLYDAMIKYQVEITD